MAQTTRTAFLASLLGALALLVPVAARGEEPPLVYRYNISFRTPGVAHVHWSALGPDGRQGLHTPQGKTTLLRLCLEMEGTARFIDNAVAGNVIAMRPHPIGERRPMKVSADDADCLEAELPPGDFLEVDYTVRLGEMADKLGDLDSATAMPGGFVFTDRALLLRPEPTPDEGRVLVEVLLPEGSELAAPWTRLPPRTTGPASHSTVYQLSIDELDGGGYLALGKLRTMPSIPIRGGVVDPVLFDVPHTTPDETLSAWVRDASTMLADFHGGLPNRRILTILAGIPRRDEGSEFGTVMKRSPTPSVVLLYGADSKPEAFVDDWMAPHEIFHVGNPAIRGRFPWFIEGFTTYYQDVVRARAKPSLEARMWADLVKQFRRHCDGSRPLLEESRRMRELHNWMRVYWGGACLAFETDVAIRARTKNKESLDTVLRAMLADSREEPLDEETVIARLDRAAGGLVRGRLRTNKKVPLADLEKKLGIEPRGDTVVLHDDAPLSSVRRAIFAPAKAGAL